MDRDMHSSGPGMLRPPSQQGWAGRGSGKALSAHAAGPRLWDTGRGVRWSSVCCGRGIFSVLSPDQTTTPGEISRAEEAELSLRGPLNESFPDGALWGSELCTPTRPAGLPVRRLAKYRVRHPNDTPVSCPARWPTHSHPRSKMSPRHTDTRPRGLSGLRTTDLPLLAYWDRHA